MPFPCVTWEKPIQSGHANIIKMALQSFMLSPKFKDEELKQWDIFSNNSKILFKSHKVGFLYVCFTKPYYCLPSKFFLKVCTKLLIVSLYSLIICPLWIIQSFIDLRKARKSYVFIQITAVCKFHPGSELSMLNRALTPSGHKGVIEEITAPA